MKNIRIGQGLLVLTILFYIGENCYFGWNKTALSSAEAYCDTFYTIGFYTGFMIYFSPLYSLYKHSIAKMEIEKHLIEADILTRQSDSILQTLKDNYINTRFFIDNKEYKGYGYLKRVIEKNNDGKVSFVLSTTLSDNHPDYREIIANIEHIKVAPASWN